ncbi:MAG: phage tail protein [Acidimicrobiales bacterium]
MTEPGKEVDYGLTMRFEVSIDGFDLGTWSKCEGLGLEWTVKKWKEGGENSYTHNLPERLEYKNLVLTRAMSLEGSAKVMAFVAGMGSSLLGKGIGSLHLATATISLYDSRATKVAAWVVRGVFPVKWSGPDLNSSGKDVAFEKLELAHQGFMEAGAAGALTATGQSEAASALGHLVPDKAKLINMGNPLEFVIFDFNPQTLTIKGGAKLSHKGAASPKNGKAWGSADVAGFLFDYRKTNPITVSFKALLDAGAMTCPSPTMIMDRVDTLISWTRPGNASLLGAAISALGGKNVTMAPTKVLFQWGIPGLGFLINGHLEQVDATYERFDDVGNPLRAEVTITLKEVPEWQPFTNPTSGGVPGRSAHMLSAGETLPGVARRSYGSAGAWRTIADANGIDDPLRVRPGTTLMLPAPSELDEHA